VAAVEVGADSAVAGEGTGAKNAIYGLTVFVQKLQQLNLKPHLPTEESPSSEKTQLNVEMSLLVVKISQNKKRVRLREDPRSSLLKKQRAWIKEYE